MNLHDGPEPGWCSKQRESWEKKEPGATTPDLRKPINTVVTSSTKSLNSHQGSIWPEVIKRSAGSREVRGPCS